MALKMALESQIRLKEEKMGRKDESKRNFESAPVSNDTQGTVFTLFWRKLTRREESESGAQQHRLGDAIIALLRDLWNSQMVCDQKKDFATLFWIGRPAGPTGCSFRDSIKGALTKCSQWLWTCQAVVESRAKLQSYLFYQDVVTNHKRENLFSPFKPTLTANLQR